MIDRRKFELKYSSRDKKCRICDEQIDRDILHAVLEQVHVSPKYVDLAFHIDCLKTAMKEIYEPNN